MLKIVPFFLIFCIIGCIPPPEFPEQQACESQDFRGVFILNEGNWTQNNARLDLWQDTSFCTGIFEQINEQPLGDVANFALLQTDTLFLVINNSRLLYKIHLPSMKLLATLAFSPQSSPREMVIINAHQAFITSFHTQFLYEIDPVAMQMIDSIKVENSMEGILATGNKLFVACGSHPFDGTNQKLAIIDLVNRTPRYISLPAENPGDLALYQNQVLVSCKGNFDPNGGGSAVVAVDAIDEKIIWQIPFQGSVFDMEVLGDQLFVIRDSSIANINLLTQEVRDNFILKADLGFDEKDLIYSMNYDQQSGELYIGVAPFGALDGQVIRMNPFLDVLETKKAGLYPGQIFFYR